MIDCVIADDVEVSVVTDDLPQVPILELRLCDIPMFIPHEVVILCVHLPNAIAIRSAVHRGKLLHVCFHTG